MDRAAITRLLLNDFFFPPALQMPREKRWKKGESKRGKVGQENTQLRKRGVVAFPQTINCQGYFWQREKEKGPDCACLKLLYFCPDCGENDGIK